ncbi:putative solute carrier family 22 member 31 isoform X3 [Pyrgilauda ruficollis]|uniref:putative solute carrier family 22 member 31 isoform X3 n=1 Tax=Pyrgilauda ruficollis TaxID=221976 RepID=UPI001B8761F6|nr:putative solute carrier family 22 member 31 isoform X3 [Pyrgilauda ruficollis]
MTPGGVWGWLGEPCGRVLRGWRVSRALGTAGTAPSPLSPHFCLWGGGSPDALQPHPSQPCGQCQGVCQAPHADTSPLCPRSGTWCVPRAGRCPWSRPRTCWAGRWVVSPPAWLVTGSGGPRAAPGAGGTVSNPSQLVPGRFGRRPTFLLSLALAVPAGLAVALAVDFLMVLVARLLFGAALAGAFLALYVARECEGGVRGGLGAEDAPGRPGVWDAAGCPGVVWNTGCSRVQDARCPWHPLWPPRPLPGLELCDPPHRLGVTMVAGFFWIAGELLLPGLALLCRDWRVLQGAVTMILALLAASWWCPALLLESPRWLLATRQPERARKTLQALAEDNCPQDSLLAELEALSEGPPRPRYHSVCEICSTRVIWKNGVILGFAAFIGSGIRHCFTRNLVPHLPHFFSSHLALLGTEAAACLFVCLTAERFGRRAILLLCTVLTGISSLLLLALTQCKPPRDPRHAAPAGGRKGGCGICPLTCFPPPADLLELIVLTLSVVGTAASHAVTMLSIFFASEVLPTVVRGAGLGLVVGANFVGKAAAPITAIPNSRGFFLHHVVFASFAILAVLSIMLLPESQGRGLPQSLQDGESQRRPPLFRRPPREDHLPLLAPHAIPHDYSCLAASTKRMLRSPEPPREM